MPKRLLFTFILGLATITLFSQQNPIQQYRKKSYMIPMRDGVKLFTVVLAPEHATAPVPILIQRTPYGSDMLMPDNTVFSVDNMGIWKSMAKEGYIFVFQDIRGKYKSEGRMEIHQPLTHGTKPGSIDESTDTWDAVDWLVKHIPGNNQKAGIFGISYPGWLALVGAVDPHPALKASSEQACMGDLFLGDDFHHYGAFRLSYGMEYTYMVEADPTQNSDFPFPRYDLYDWYLKLGPLKNVNEKYFRGRIPTWNHFVNHPNYDSFWKSNSPLHYISHPQIPQLHVGGYYDQEDINGPQLMYAHLEKKDSFDRNHIVLGPWNHGQWGHADAESLGRIRFGSATGEWFRELQKKWFDYWLKGIGDGRFEEAYCFQTGSNQWKSYAQWPPREASIRKLYLSPDHTCSFTPPAQKDATVEFLSDPANPVPYRSLPIEATYGSGSRWGAWQVEDQRFVYGRPDVASFTMDALHTDLTVTGSINAHLQVSTSGTDADWVVKLIDVYPDFDTADLSMSGYQLPVAMEVFRGRFRKGFEHPQPMTPGKPEEVTIDLHQVNHVFRKGHKIMVQVQSTWFPVIDRNPQQFVPNIFEAKAEDYIKATHRIHTNTVHPTYIALPVMQ